MYFTIKNQEVLWEKEGEKVLISAYKKDVIRVQASRNNKIDAFDWGNLLPREDVPVEICEEGDEIVFRNGKTTCRMRENGMIRFLNEKNETILEEHYRDRRASNAPIRPARVFQAITGDVFVTDLYFHAYKEEKLYGMGQYLNDCLDLKGTVLELAQKNTQCSIPFVLSSRGYGFLWNNPSVGQVEFAKNHTRWHSDGTKQIDYFIFCGDSPAEIQQKYAALSGYAPKFPEWAAGLWQSKLRYLTQDELLEVAREYKQRDLPLSVIVCDYFHWPKQGEWKFDLAKWPDPKAMCEELKEMGVELMVSIWPTVDPESENYDEMSDKGYLVRTEQGVQSVFLYLGPQTYYDATNPQAREFIWKCAKKNYFENGIKMFWLDEAEPEMRPYSFTNTRYWLGNGREVSNIYPLNHAMAFYDGQVKEGQEDIVNLIRCCWIGSQRYGVVMWSGDCASNFEAFRHQIKAALNIGIAGIPWWTSDIGGFWDGDPEDPMFRELIVRWYQFGVFCPVFRMHGHRKPYLTKLGGQGTGSPNEIWSFGQENYEIMKKWLFVRERLRPYIMRLMDASHETGEPVMRPMFYDYPDEKACWELEEQYMFGPDVLVAPVFYQGMTKRDVFLPSGEKWKDANSGMIYDGGITVNVDEPLDVIPVFLRVGGQVEKLF